MLKKYFVPVLFACLILSLASCQKDGPSDGTNTNGPDTTQNNMDFGTITFTARGEKVICANEENAATFTHDFDGVNLLSIFGIDRDLPKYHEYNVQIGLILKGEIAVGTYQLVGPGVYGECISEGKGCDGQGQGAILPNGDINQDTKAAEKVLQSTSGTLKITKVNVGNYVNGFAEGSISGTFSFSGTELGKYGQNPGTAEGKFENIPLLVVK